MHRIDFIQAWPNAAFYFSGSRCGACEILWPKVQLLFQDQFPKLPLISIPGQENRELTTELGIFTFPALIIFLEGKETLRKVPFLSCEEIREPLSRLYELLFLARR